MWERSLVNPDQGIIAWGARGTNQTRLGPASGKRNVPLLASWLMRMPICAPLRPLPQGALPRARRAPWFDHSASCVVALTSA